ncbi:MAG: alpha/beta fold hydrolase [Thermoanaerobaculia bacterium]
MSIGTFGGVPYVTVGHGSIPVVVISGGDAFVRRFDTESAMRNAERIVRLFPPTCTLYILGYDASSQLPIEELIETTAGFVRAQSGRAVLAGISFGGFLAMRLAATHPELVHGLILISTAQRFSPEGRARIAQQIADIQRGNLAAMARPFIALFRRRRLNLAVRFALWLRRRSFDLRMNDPRFVTHMLEIALACSDAPPTDTIRTPALILLGERDQFFDIASAMPHAELVTFPRETHMLAVEHAGGVRRAIETFLRRV